MIKGIIWIFLKNPVLANILMLLIVIGGMTGTCLMVREIFPNFSLDIITVTVPYPGADPEEVEEAICLKLEEVLEGIEGIAEVRIVASEGVGSAIIECRENADVLQVKDEVKTAIDSITTFPADAENPRVIDIKFRGEVLALIVSGDLPEHQIKEVANQIKDELLNRRIVTQASVSGIRDYEISIEISEEKLRQYGVSFEQLRNAVAKNGINIPSGTIRTQAEDIRIRALGRRYQANDYRNIPVVHRPDGTIIPLGQLATIRNSFDLDSQVIAEFSGHPAVSINVFKTEDEDSVVIAKAVDQYMEQKRYELPKNVSLTKFRDNSRIILDRLNLLIDNGKIGLIFVFLSLWLFLDIRLSFWVTMGIPISLAGALAIMASIGGSINMLSMFGLIMVLGLIVDDAIVVGEAIYTRRQLGESALDAAVNGTAEVALPVLAAVTTTIVAFIPLFFIKGVMGKFIKEIPIPVIACLSVSLVEALFILPVHLRHLPRPDGLPKRRILRATGKFRQGVQRGMDFTLDRVYEPMLQFVLRWRYAALCVAIVVLVSVAGMIGGNVIQYVFLPKADEDFIRATVELPPGTPIDETKKVSHQLHAGWQKTETQFKPLGDKPLTVALFSLIGGSVDWRELGGQSNKIEMTIELLPSEKRNAHYQNLILAWQKNTGKIPGAIATSFVSFNHVPGGKPIGFQLLGNDQQQLLAAADKLADKLNSINGVFDVQLDYRPGNREFIVEMKSEASNLGLTLDDIARHLQSGFYGSEALRIQRGRDDIKVKIRYPEVSGRNSIRNFEDLRIPTPSGVKVPLRSVARIHLAEGQSRIFRKDRMRFVTVSADIDTANANAELVLNQLKEDFLPDLCTRYDVLWKLEGQSQETRNSLGSLLIGFPLALFFIYFIIASIFKSYLQPAVIMTTIPFGLIGAVFGHMIFGYPLTLMSMFGMVALAGIVVNDAIVLIEGINSRLEAGIPLFPALIEGGKRRFRPIFLTTLTTFVGLMPLILEKSMQAQFLIPMAISIAFGVLFATVLTLILIPCLIAIMNDFRRLWCLVWHLKWPTREEVEPRSMKESA
jgi:multidrug efflux pump subunit AcrB